MAKQQFIDLATEISKLKLFDIEKVASFLEVNFDVISHQTESQEADYKLKSLLIDRDKFDSEIKAIKSVLSVHNPDSRQVMLTQQRLAQNKRNLSKTEDMIAVLKTKKKRLQLDVNERKSMFVLEELKSFLKGQMGDQFVPFIQDIEQKSDKIFFQK